ncbi:MAG: hypothetical protein HZB80_08125 [Deltaproteobacteria bacterium]|nr:hypothetical protein [Deltaproteobacteria bacterium]
MHSASRIYIAVFSLVGSMLFGGCATLDTMTGKADMEKKVSTLEQQLADSKAEGGRLKESILKLEKQISSEKASFEEQKARYGKEIEELQKKVETAKVKGMTVMLFGGDIVYEIAVEGYKDFRAALRYRSLLDESFKTAFEQFEGSKGGDSVILGVLKEIDKSGDRLIDAREAINFRKAEEDKFSTKKKNE